MGIISEAQKILLAKLKFRDPMRYNEKRNILGVSESELVDYIQRENLRIKSVTKFMPKKDNPVTGHANNSGVFLLHISQLAAHRKVTKNSIKNMKTIILLDGDNHPYEAIEGIDKMSRKADIFIFATNETVLKKIRQKSSEKGNKQVQTIPVKRGDQAVDNRIKARAGTEARNHSYSKTVIVSHDQGYRKNIKEWKRKWKWSNDGIILCKQIKDVPN